MNQYFFITLIISCFFSDIDCAMVLSSSSKTSLATKSLLEAINMGSVQFVKCALLASADITYKDGTNNSLLMIASKSKKEDVALYLLEQSYFQQADILNHLNAFQETVLMSAAQHNQEKLVSQLLTMQGININAQCRGYSALDFGHNHSAIVELLMKYNANPMLRNEHGATIAFYRNFLDPSEAFKPTAEKIIHQTDAAGNTHLHFLVQAMIGSMARAAQEDVKILFDNILTCLVMRGLSIWKANKNRKLPIEIAYEKYQKLHKHYKKDQLCYRLELLNNQERILHTLLRYYVKQKSIFITHILRFLHGLMNLI